MPNDTQLTVLGEEGSFLLVQKPDGESGWIRSRNVAAEGRVSGVTSEMVTPNPEYDTLDSRDENLQLWNQSGSGARV